MLSANGLIDDIERRLAAGHLNPGDRLPSVREQARAQGLAPNTVAAAYRRLRERGVVTGRGRQGTLIAARPLVTPVASPMVPEGVVDAMTGNPDPALLPDISTAMAAAVAGPAARYGDELLDQALASAAQAMFVSDRIPADAITVVSGAMDAVERLLSAHLRSGDGVAVEDPGYASVHQVVGGLGFKPVPVSCDELGMRPTELATALAEGVDAVIVTPRATNPTGAAFDPHRAEELDTVLLSYPDVLVIQDDHAGPISGIDFVGLNTDRRRWAVVRSVAKSLGPDLRLALVAGDRSSIDRVDARLQIGPGWVSKLLQRAVAVLLTDPEASVAVDHAATIYRVRRTRLGDALRSEGLHASGRSGLHIWLSVRDEQAVVMAVRDRGFAVRAGARFRVHAPPAVRITTASLSEHQIDDLSAVLVEVLGPRAARTRTA